MNKTAEKVTLSELQQELDAATTELEFQRIREDAARMATTSAMNRLNAAHKALDAAMDALRSTAPWDSEWRRKVSQRSCGSDAP